MRYLIALVCIILLMGAKGCEDSNSQPPLFEGNVKFHKVNGQVAEITVSFPTQNSGTSPSITLQNREQIAALEVQLESMLKDIHYAMEQMPVVEPDLEDE